MTSNDLMSMLRGEKRYLTQIKGFMFSFIFFY